jgi:hypothetical protein
LSGSWFAPGRAVDTQLKKIASSEHGHNVHDSSVAHETNDLDIQEITQNIGTEKEWTLKTKEQKTQEKLLFGNTGKERNQASMLSFGQPYG